MATRLSALGDDVRQLTLRRQALALPIQEKAVFQAAQAVRGLLMALLAALESYERAVAAFVAKTDQQAFSWWGWPLTAELLTSLLARLDEAAQRNSPPPEAPLPPTEEKAMAMLAKLARAKTSLGVYMDFAADDDSDPVLVVVARPILVDGKPAMPGEKVEFRAGLHGR